MSEPKYYVVQVYIEFIKNISDYWCVIRDWIQNGLDDPKVIVTFPYRRSIRFNTPLLAPLPTESQLEQTLGTWKDWIKVPVQSVVKYRTDSYDDVKRYFQELLDNEEKYKAEHSRTSPRLAALHAKKNFMTNGLGLTTSPILYQYKHTKAQKRKAADGGRKAHNKKSKVPEPNVGEEVAGLSKQPFELINDYQPLTHAMPVEETQEASVGKSNETTIQHTYSTEDQPTVNASETNHLLEHMSRKSLSESNIPAQTDQNKTLISVMSIVQEQLKKIYPILMEIKSTNNKLETDMASLSAQNEELIKQIEQLEVQKTKDKNHITLLEDKIEDLQRSK